MKPGDVLRQRQIRAYDPNPVNYQEIATSLTLGDPETLYVTLLLGSESYRLVDEEGNPVGLPLDIDKALNSLGWWSEEQIRDALGRRGSRTIERVREKVAERRANDDTAHKSMDPPTGT